MKKSTYRNLMLCVAAVTPVVLQVGRARADLLIADGFDYPTGFLAGNVESASGHSWVLTGPSTNIIVAAGSLAYPGTGAPPALPGDSAADAYNSSVKLTNNATTTADRISLPQAVASGTLYYSFTMQVTNLGTSTSFNTTNGSFIAGFNNLTGPQSSALTTAGAVLCIRHDTVTNTADYELGISQNQAPTSLRTYSTTDFSTSDILFVVGTYTFNSTTGDSSNLYIFSNTDAISATEPATPFVTSQGTTTTGLSTEQIQSFFLRNNSAAAAATLIDDVRVGTTYADVVSGTVITDRGNNLFWNSTTSGVWDTSTGAGTGTGTANWYNSNTDLATDIFQTGDGVTFADPGTAAGMGTLNTPLQSAITLDTMVSPKSVTVTSNSTDYSISGAGSIASGSLTLSGTSSLTLSTSNTFTGGTKVKSGQLILASANAFPMNTALAVSTGGQVTVADHGTHAIYVPQASTLTNTGTIDITNNDLLIHNGDLPTIESQVAAAFDGGAWDGTSATGVITSSTAQTDASHLTAVGVATGLTLASFDGVATVPTDVLVKYTYYGDANLDGVVDGSDYTLIDAGFNSETSDTPLTGWQNGDFNYDGMIDGSDYTLIDNAFNTQGSSLGVNPAAVLAGASAVPEPATLGLLGIVSATLLARRRRRR